MYFDGAEVRVDTIGTVTNSILHNVTVTNNGNIKNCVSDTKLPGAQELTEAGGVTVTATLDGCAGEVSGETLYFTGTPTLKVKVKGGTVEKANGEDVGQADENGWHTVTAAEDGNIKLTKSTPTPNPDDQPKTYTVTVKGGKINNETEVKAEKGTKLTVDVDESEVPEGMTFDVWSIRFPKGVEDTLTGDPSVMLHDPTWPLRCRKRTSPLRRSTAPPSCRARTMGLRRWAPWQRWPWAAQRLASWYGRA